MRLSVDKSDSGYRPDAHRFDVYIDGVKCNDCVTADDELGEAIVYARDDRGKLIVEEGCIERQTVRGHITFVPKPQIRGASPQLDQLRRQEAEFVLRWRLLCAYLATPGVEIEPVDGRQITIRLGSETTAHEFNRQILQKAARK